MKIFFSFMLTGFFAPAFMFFGIVDVHAAENSEPQTEMLNLVNVERRKHGLNPLVLDRDLNNGAMIRAREISEYFSHTRPDGTACFTVLPNYKRHYVG